MEKNKMSNTLSKLESIGNKLPHPVTIFLIFLLILMMVSHVLYLFDIDVTYEGINPESGNLETITKEAISLLAPDSITYIFTSVVSNFTSFVALGPVLVAMLGVGVAEKTGYLGALVERGVRFAPKYLITPMVILLGVLSNVAASVGYVVLVPLGALIFLSYKRHPVAGLAAAFAGVAGGYSANLILGTNDPILSGMSTEAAQILDANYIVNATDNWFFMFISTFLIIIIGTYITDKIVEPSLGTYTTKEKEDVILSDGNKRAFKWANLSLMVIVIAILLMVLPASGILRGENGEFIGSPFIQSIIFIMMLVFLIPGIIYGIVNKTIRNDKDAVAMMTDSIKMMAEFIVLIFFAAQFVALFEYSNIGIILSVESAKLLEALHINGPIALIFLILITAVVNIFIAADSAKWGMMAPIFIPMFMQLDIPPEITQVAYRIGDSSTNIVSPLMPFFPYIVSIASRYGKNNGIGTVISIMLPYSVLFLIGWTILFIIWYVLGIPVGPGTNISL